MIRLGSIVEIDRSHLPVALKLPVERRKLAGKVVKLDTEDGWTYIRVNSHKAGVEIEVAVPPVGTKHLDKLGRGPKVRLIR